MLVASVASKKGKDSEKFRALFLTINLHFLKISRKRESLINRYCVDAENKKDLFKKIVRRFSQTNGLQNYNIRKLLFLLNIVQRHDVITVIRRLSREAPDIVSVAQGCECLADSNLVDLLHS